MPAASRIRLSSWYFLSVMVSYMSLFFSLSIILDLYYVLKNPFSSTEARIKKMTAATVITSIILAALGLKLTLSKDNYLAKLNLVLFGAISLGNILLGIVAMIFVLIRFRTKGMSENIKKSI